MNPTSCLQPRSQRLSGAVRTGQKHRRYAVGMDTFTMAAIGWVRSPHRRRADSEGAEREAHGRRRVEIRPELEAGLTDIEGFSHLYVIWAFHRAEGYDLMTTPPNDDRPHGLFATRTPRRPNPIALSVVELIRRDGSPAARPRPGHARGRHRSWTSSRTCCRTCRTSGCGGEDGWGGGGERRLPHGKMHE